MRKLLTSQMEDNNVSAHIQRRQDMWSQLKTLWPEAPERLHDLAMMMSIQQKDTNLYQSLCAQGDVTAQQVIDRPQMMTIGTSSSSSHSSPSLSTQLLCLQLTNSSTNTGKQTNKSPIPQHQLPRSIVVITSLQLTIQLIVKPWKLNNNLLRIKRFMNAGSFTQPTSLVFSSTLLMTPQTILKPNLLFLAKMKELKLMSTVRTP